MPKNDNEKLALEDLIRAESEVLRRIHEEIETEVVGGIIAGHNSHASGHYSSGGHNSSVARVESLDPKKED
jgi:hypothetical protein